MSEEENEVEKKSYKWLRTMIVIVVILAVLAAGMMWYGRTTTAGSKVRGQNSLAET
jgi:flagellar basal body-associated protein FliL